MNEAATATATIAPETGEQRWRSLGDRGFRWVLTTLLFILGCSLAYGFGKFWAEWRQAARPLAIRQTDSTALSPLAAALPLAGPWSFDEVDWNLRSQLSARQDVDAQFATLAAAAPKQSDELLPDTDQEFLDLIAALRIQPTEQAGNQVYRVERPDLKAILVGRTVAGQPKTVAVAVAYPQAGDQWQLFEFTPNQETAADANPAAAHLLPLPATARRASGRFADDGRLLLEFVSLDSTTQKLLADWKAAGWEVRPSGLADPGAFSYLCAHGDEMIYAWSDDPADAVKNLMLVRAPAAADTSP